jgi:hypothetical protein
MELQKLFRANYVEKLREGVKNRSLVKYYESDTFLFDLEQVMQSPLIFKPAKGDLILPDSKSFYDFENSRIIYEAYKSLTPLQASDTRLWTYLAHTDYYNYMSKRWPGVQNKTASNQSKYILDHWFITSPAQSNFIRHGISGLWWAAYLTYDETRTDKYELTKILYTQLDFATRTLGTYSLARHKEAVSGVLEYILQNPPLFKNNFEAKSRYVTKYLNQVGGTKPLSYFKRDFFKNSLHSVRDRIDKAA